MSTETVSTTAAREFDARQNFRSLVRSFVSGWWILVLCTILGGGAGLAYSLSQTPIYRAAATLYVTSGVDVNSQSAYQSSLASQQRVTSYARLVVSEPVITDALKSSDIPLTPAQAQSMLSATTQSETVLLTVIADGPDPKIAGELVNAVSQSLSRYVEKLESPKGSTSPLATLTVVNPAVVTSSPIEPKTTRNILLGALIGLAVGVAILLVRRHFDTRIRTASDVNELIPTPVLTSIPVAGTLRKTPVIDFTSGSNPAAEAFRKLRSGMGFVSLEKPARSILVTSANAGDGKTTVVLNLAAALAESSSKVILVDGDLRRPSLAPRLGLSSDIGLTTVLRNDATLSEVIQRTTLPSGHQVSVLAAGAQPPNPSELLGMSATEALFESLTRDFDYVIIDSTPVLPVTDAAVASQAVDSVLLVVRANSTNDTDLLGAVDELSAARARLLGIVVNAATPRTGKSGYY